MCRTKLLILITALAVPTLSFASGAQEADSAPSSISYWNVFDPAISQDGERHVEKYDEYEENTGIEVDNDIQVYGDLRQRLIVSNQAQDGPDIQHMLGEWVYEMSQMGMLVDITERVEAWEHADSFPDSAWNVATVDGQIYGIPSVASARTLVYREDVFEENGISAPPETWEELREVARELTMDTDDDGEIDQYGFAFASSSDAIRGPQEFAVHLWSTGGNFVTEDGDGWTVGFTEDQAEQVFQFYYDLMHVDESVPPYSLGWEYQELDDAFEAGSVMMTQNGRWMRNRAERTEHGESWQTAPYPYHSEPATYLEVKVEGLNVHGTSPDAAWDFLTWLMDRDNLVYISQTDNLPARTDSSDSEYWVDDPTWTGTFVDVVPDGRSMPPISMGAIFDYSMEYVQEVLYERMEPAEAAEGFYESVESYLEQSVN